MKFKILYSHCKDPFGINEVHEHEKQSTFTTLTHEPLLLGLTTLVYKTQELSYVIITNQMAI